MPHRKSRTFDEIVEWAYSTLRRRSKTSPTSRHSSRRRASCGRLEEKNWRAERNVGCYSGVVRTKQSHMQMKVAPIYLCFRGPILRCSRETCGRSERVVWHEVATGSAMKRRSKCRPWSITRISSIPRRFTIVVHHLGSL